MIVKVFFFYTDLCILKPATLRLYKITRTSFLANDNRTDIPIDLNCRAFILVLSSRSRISEPIVKIVNCLQGNFVIFNIYIVLNHQVRYAKSWEMDCFACYPRAT